MILRKSLNPARWLGILGFFLVLGRTAQAGSLLISWDPVSDSRVAGYKVKYGTASGTYTGSVNAAMSTSQTLQNLTQGTTYYFVVVAYDSAGTEGSPSSEASGVVLNTASIASTSVGPGSATISWQTNKPADQQVDYGTSTSYGMSTALNSSLLLNHSEGLTNLQPETTYHYRVRSRDEGGSVAQSADMTFTTPAEILISTLSPTSGTAGTQVVINGKGFGSSSSSNKVTFSGVQASVTSWGQSSITASVPSGAVSGPVVVMVNSSPSNGVNFKIDGKLPPPGRFRVKGY